MMARAVSAILLASATAATFVGRRSINRRGRNERFIGSVPTTSPFCSWQLSATRDLSEPRQGYRRVALSLRYRLERMRDNWRRLDRGGQATRRAKLPLPDVSDTAGRPS